MTTVPYHVADGLAHSLMAARAFIASLAEELNLDPDGVTVQYRGHLGDDRISILEVLDGIDGDLREFYETQA